MRKQFGLGLIAGLGGVGLFLVFFSLLESPEPVLLLIPPVALVAAAAKLWNGHRHVSVGLLVGTFAFGALMIWIAANFSF